MLFHREDLYGPFRVEAGRVGCVAEISAFSPLPDGRSLMMTEGVERFRIVDGVESETLYHEALVEEYPDLEDIDAELIVRRHHTVELFKTLLRSLSEPALESLRLDSRRDVSFNIASAIEIDPVWHQDLLELRSERRRLKRIDDLVRAVLEAGQND